MSKVPYYVFSAISALLGADLLLLAYSIDNISGSASISAVAGIPVNIPVTRFGLAVLALSALGLSVAFLVIASKKG